MQLSAQIILIHLFIYFLPFLPTKINLPREQNISDKQPIALRYEGPLAMALTIEARCSSKAIETVGKSGKQINRAG
ncbi:MAG: hypothetical protein A2Z25_02695 [Planctomycetes bacterium RBG_16_55_9]|nr:MAG: hypothetical protein A2Z25_02695 [Planctomycetes bacterium RBG_16_55_9]